MPIPRLFSPSIFGRAGLVVLISAFGLALAIGQGTQEAALEAEAMKYVEQASDEALSTEDRIEALRRLKAAHDRMREIKKAQGERWKSRDDGDGFKSLVDYILPANLSNLAGELKVNLAELGPPRLEVPGALGGTVTVKTDGDQKEYQLTKPLRPWVVQEPSSRRPATDDQRLTQMLQEIGQESNWYLNELADIQRNAGLYFRTAFQKIAFSVPYQEETIWKNAELFAQRSGAGTREWMARQLSSARRLETWRWLDSVMDKTFEDLQSDHLKAQEDLQKKLLFKQETWQLNEATAYQASLQELCSALVSVEQMLVWYIGAPTFDKSEEEARARADARTALGQQQPVVLRLWLKWKFEQAYLTSLGTVVMGDAAPLKQNERLKDALPAAEAEYKAALDRLNLLELEMMNRYFGWRIKDGLERAIPMPTFRPHLPSAGHEINFYRNLFMRSPPADIDHYERLRGLGFFKNCQSSDETYTHLLTKEQLDAFHAESSERAAAVSPATLPDGR
jgi:hypothetical protein